MVKRKSRRRGLRGCPPQTPPGHGRPAGSNGAPRHPGPPPERAPADGAVWLYGTHSALAALANPRRRCSRIVATAETKATLAPMLERAVQQGGARPPIETVARTELDRLLPHGAVHQGLAVRASPLATVFLEDIADAGGDATVVVLDQTTDPQNVGAVLRAAAAFGSRAVIVQDRHTPPATGALAKAASGALEMVPLVRVTNLARAMRALKEAEFWCVGLDAEAGTALPDARLGGRTALVLGAEGAGLRRLTRDTCDLLVRIPIRATVDSLNVAAAAAVALYEIARAARAR